MSSKILIPFVFGFVHEDITLSLFRSRGQGFSFCYSYLIASFYILILTRGWSFLSGLKNLLCQSYHLLFAVVKLEPPLPHTTYSINQSVKPLHIGGYDV